MTVKVQGKSFEFSEDEAREVMKQLFGQYFDFRGTLEYRDIEADDKMMDFIEKNLFDEVLDDDMFWDLLEKNVLWIADRFAEERNNG